MSLKWQAKPEIRICSHKFMPRTVDITAFNHWFFLASHFFTPQVVLLACFYFLSTITYVTGMVMLIKQYNIYVCVCVCVYIHTYIYVCVCVCCVSVIRGVQHNRYPN